MSSDCKISIDPENRKQQENGLNGLAYDSYKHLHESQLSKTQEVHVMQNVPSATTIGESALNFDNFDLVDLKYRFAKPVDKTIIQRLCEDFFPVHYPESWFDDICAANSRFYTLLGTYSDEVVAFLVAELKPRSRMASEDIDMVDGEYSYCCLPLENHNDCDSASQRQWQSSASTQHLDDHSSSFSTSLSPNGLKRQVRVAYVLSLGVVAPLRRRGVACAIMQHLLDFLSEPAQADCRCVYLHVLATNRSAIHLYEQRFGFRRYAFLPNYYSVRNAPAHGYSYVLFVNGGRAPRDCLAQLYDAVRALRRRYTVATRCAVRLVSAPFSCIRRLLARTCSHSLVLALRSVRRRPVV